MKAKMTGVVRGGMHVARKVGLNRASVRGFHSFRVTWVTLALTAGVPLELVQKVTGHRTTDIVLKHYFQPGREAFREALQKAMPALLTNGEKGKAEIEKAESGNERDQEMRGIVAKMTAKTWRRDRKVLLRMLTR
jgi:hypothetical protein